MMTSLSTGGGGGGSIVAEVRDMEGGRKKKEGKREKAGRDFPWRESVVS